jgi:hypothetical protein
LFFFTEVVALVASMDSTPLLNNISISIYI